MENPKKCASWGNFIAGDRVRIPVDTRTYRVVEAWEDDVVRGFVPIVLENNPKGPILYIRRKCLRREYA